MNQDSNKLLEDLVQAIKQQSYKIEKLTQNLYEMKDRERQLERLQHSMEDNMRRLTDMMKELRGLTASIRPLAAKNDWYKTELDINAAQPLAILQKFEIQSK